MGPSQGVFKQISLTLQTGKVESRQKFCGTHTGVRSVSTHWRDNIQVDLHLRESSRIEWTPL